MDFADWMSAAANISRLAGRAASKRLLAHQGRDSHPAAITSYNVVVHARPKIAASLPLMRQIN
jgi:hypothetical protein